MYTDGKPSMSHGTLIVVPLLPKGSPSGTNSSWSATIEDVDDNAIKVQVNHGRISFIFITKGYKYPKSVKLRYAQLSIAQTHVA